MKKSKKNEKLTVAEYLKLKEQREKSRFHFTFYPWPVTLLILLPFIILCLLFLAYFLHINNVGE